MASQTVPILAIAPTVVVWLGTSWFSKAAFKQTADIALEFGVIKQPAGDGAYTHEIWELAQKK